MPRSAGPPSRDPEPLLPDEPAGGIRLNRFFTEQGLCSRREADRLIEQGRITINGRPAVLGDRVQPGDRIAKDGVVVPWGNSPLYIKCHKPVGITTTSEPHVPGNLIAFIGHAQRIFPIGRLDKDSSGLILLTNDGSIVNKILRAENRHEKEYLVEVDPPFDDRFLAEMARGVVILGTRTRPARTQRAGPRTFHIVLTEGRNRQIRRMCQALGYRVVRLQRIRIMHITLADLAPGAWCELTTRERDELLRTLKEDGKREAGSGRRETD
jgi:23S rRNA pseudouridine2604 synthase